jgi:predicted ester cyclase
MEPQDPAYLARSLYEYWNARKLERLGELVATDAEILVIGSGARFRGPSGAIEHARIWADAFPDGHIAIDRMIAVGGRVVVEYTETGTHTGPLRSSSGSIPGSGRSVTLNLCDILEIEEGKIRSIRSFFDSGSLLMQIGLISETGTTTRLKT